MGRNYVTPSSCKVKAFLVRSDWLVSFLKKDFAAICDLISVIKVERLLARIPGHKGISDKTEQSLSNGIVTRRLFSVGRESHFLALRRF
jgi:hypothetical protein